MERDEDRLTCKVCLESFHLKYPAFQHWLTGVCIPMPIDTRPQPISSAIHIGKLISHVSHRMQSFQGVIYCTKCGSIGKHHFSNLAQVCSPPGEYGKSCLRHIRSGMLPPSLSSPFAVRSRASLRTKQARRGARRSTRAEGPEILICPLPTPVPSLKRARDPSPLTRPTPCH